MRPPAPAALVLGALALAVSASDQDQGAKLRGRVVDKLSLSQREQQDNREVTKVVRMLEEMLKESKTEGDTEKELYAKHKCYCDTQKSEKTTSIADLGSKIQLLAAQIEKNEGEVGMKSIKRAENKKSMEDNQEQQSDLTSIRNQEEKVFADRRDELVEMSQDLTNALKILEDIGADQAFAAEGHTQQMAKFGASMTQMQRALKQASIAAVAFGKLKHAEKLSGFLQASTKGMGPFTATYSTQSGEIFGILADMKDTSEKELKEIGAKEEAAIQTFKKVMKVLGEEYAEMEDKEMRLGQDLSFLDKDTEKAKNMKGAAEIEKGEAEDFLAKLLDMCSEKANQYDKRVQLRAAEQTAISQAIAILNNDMAFEAFGKVGATTKGFFFLQLRSRQKGNLVISSAARRMKADAMLRKVSKHSAKAARVASMLEAENPFAKVLEAIKEMLTVIKEEEELDTEKQKWCDDERDEKNKALATAEEEEMMLAARIDELKSSIKMLKDDIKFAEDELAGNTESMTSQTAERKEDNLAYQKNIGALVEAAKLLDKAIVVLKAYYEDALAAGAAGTGFLQREDQPKFEEAEWSEYKGQSAKGNDATDLLVTILDNVKAEETAAHGDEDAAQKAYEEEMQKLKDYEATLQETLSTKQSELASQDEDLVEKKKDYKTTQELVKEITAYLKKIAPGCDFMDNFHVQRQNSRLEEKGALLDAETMLMETPAYKTWDAAQTNETLGECADACNTDEDHVECKACVNKVSIPGYCAGNPTTKGC